MQLDVHWEAKTGSQNIHDVAAEEVLVVEDVASETSFAVFRLTPTSARFSAHPT